MVSIILPTYNRASLVQESIKSVLLQSYTDFELLIIDDGSGDDTRDHVLAIGDSRIKYHQLPHTGYTGRLKNFAIAKASGDYIAFIDSDDLWKTNKLEKQVALFDGNASIDFSITDVTTFSGDTILIDHSYQLRDTIECANIFQRLKQNRFLIYNPTMVIRKTCFERTGYFSESMRSGDYHFNMRLAYYFDAGIIYEPLVLRRVHDANMSEQIPFENYAEYVETFDYLFKANMIEKKYLQSAKSIAFHKMGKLYAANGEFKKARKHYLLSLRNNLFQKGSYWHFANSILRRKPQ